MSHPITITLTFDTAAEAATTMLLLAGPKPSFKVEPIYPAPKTAEQPAEAGPAPAEPVADAPAAPVAPESHLKVPSRPRGRPRKPAEPVTIDVTPTTVVVEPPLPVSQPEPAPAQPEAATVTLGAPQEKSVTPAAPVVDVTVAPSPAPAPAAVPPLAEVQSAIERLFAAKASATTIATLQRFGAKRGRDLLDNQRAEFIAYVEAVIAGTADPVGGDK